MAKPWPTCAQHSITSRHVTHNATTNDSYTYEHDGVCVVNWLTSISDSCWSGCGRYIMCVPACSQKLVRTWSPVRGVRTLNREQRMHSRMKEPHIHCGSPNGSSTRLIIAITRRRYGVIVFCSLQLRLFSLHAARTRARVHLGLSGRTVRRFFNFVRMLGHTQITGCM